VGSARTADTGVPSRARALEYPHGERERKPGFEAALTVARERGQSEAIGAPPPPSVPP